MSKAAELEPTWDGFVHKANCVMIARHEESRDSNAALYIGGHRAQSASVRPTSSPTELSDLVAMQSEIEPDQDQRADRLQRRLSPCQCLTPGNKRILDAQYRHCALTLDQYGMLVPSKIAKRQSSCECGKHTRTYTLKRQVTKPKPKLPNGCGP